MDHLKEWGKNIRHRRLENGLTVDQLAEKVGVNRSNVVRWEAGQTEPSLEHKIAVGIALDRYPSDIFDLDSGLEI